MSASVSEHDELVFRRDRAPLSDRDQRLCPLRLRLGEAAGHVHDLEDVRDQVSESRVGLRHLVQRLCVREGDRGRRQNCGDG